MYNILEINHVEKKQKVLDSAGYLFEANQLLYTYAVNYVLKYTGLSYLKRLFYRKANLPMGYSIVYKNTNYMNKYTIYLREHQGYLYSDKITKVITFITAKTECSAPIVRKSKMSAAYKIIFQDCLNLIEKMQIVEEDDFDEI